MGYKMKGFSGFKSSPAKVSDEDIVKGEKKLAHQELDFREPGWAKVAHKVHKGAMNVISSVAGGAGGGGDKAKQETPSSSGGGSSVQKTAQGKLLEEDYKFGEGAQIPFTAGK